MSLLAAISFLTVLPVPGRSRMPPDTLGRSVGWFPMVGLLIGLLLAAVDHLAGLLIGEGARATLVVLAGLAVSGALHIDGLMDTCDGFFATVSPERRLEIMRDSHVGSFGVAGAGLVLIGKWAALFSLGPTPRWAALVLMALLSRWAMSLAIGIFPSGRTEGLGYQVRASVRPVDLVLAAASTVLIAWLTLGLTGLALWLIVSLAVWLAGRTLLHRLPGLTGDCYGSLAELAELVALFAAPVLFRVLNAS